MPVLQNAKHEAVALAYLADPQKIGWRAYRSVYPKSSQHAAETAFGRLLKIAEFADRLAELGSKAAEGAVMTANEVLLELSKLGRANMRNYVHLGTSDNVVNDVDDLSPEETAAISELTVESYSEPGEAPVALEDQAHGGKLKRQRASTRTVKRVRLKLHSKPAALDLLGKHHKLFVDRVEHDFSKGVAERLAAAIARTDGSGRKDGEVRPHRHPPRARSARKAARKGKPARAR